VIGCRGLRLPVDPCGFLSPTRSLARNTPMKPLCLRHLVPASLLIAALLVVLSGRGPATAQPQAPPAGQRWEYRVTNNQRDFNDLGDQGWELCSATVYTYSGNISGTYSFIFKRPKR
jgi:hypothetical protein